MLFRSRRKNQLAKDAPVYLMLAGFGISKGGHARAVVRAGADGAIVGSAIASIYENDLGSPGSTLPNIAALCSEIKQGCISGHEDRNNNIHQEAAGVDRYV